MGDNRDEEGYTLLHHAVVTDDEDIVNKVIMHGIPINAVNKNGFSPVHLSIGFSKLNSFLALIRMFLIYYF